MIPTSSAYAIHISISRCLEWGEEVDLYLVLGLTSSIERKYSKSVYSTVTRNPFRGWDPQRGVEGYCRRERVNARGPLLLILHIGQQPIDRIPVMGPRIVNSSLWSVTSMNWRPYKYRWKCWTVNTEESASLHNLSIVVLNGWQGTWSKIIPIKKHTGQNGPDAISWKAMMGCNELKWPGKLSRFLEVSNVAKRPGDQHYLCLTCSYIVRNWKHEVQRIS